MIISQTGKKINSYQDLMYAMALRARELADMKMDQLRRWYPATAETDTELVRLCKESGYSRGQMIEDILTEEFDVEFDKEFANE